jgi:hypothetical protein
MGQHPTRTSEASLPASGCVSRSAPPPLPANGSSRGPTLLRPGPIPTSHNSRSITWSAVSTPSRSPLHSSAETTDIVMWRAVSHKDEDCRCRGDFSRSALCRCSCIFVCRVPSQVYVWEDIIEHCGKRLRRQQHTAATAQHTAAMGCTTRCWGSLTEAQHTHLQQPGIHMLYVLLSRPGPRSVSPSGWNTADPLPRVPLQASCRHLAVSAQVGCSHP